MTKFVVLYYMNAEAAAQAQNTPPEKQAEGMKACMDWAGKCGDHLVDMGTPLGNGQAIQKDGSGPSQKDVVGYSVLQAENMDEAKKLLEGHPHLGWAEGCQVEVYECLPLPGQ